MNPVLSWTVVILSVGATYVYFYGLPNQAKAQVLDVKRRASEGTPQAAKKTNRKLRASVKPKVEALKETITEAAPALVNGTHTSSTKDENRKNSKRTKATDTATTPEPQTKSSTADHKKEAFVPAPWYNRSAGQETFEDSDDPVKNVMMGRPRKSSTPIGLQKHTPKFNELDTADGGWSTSTDIVSEEEGAQAPHLAAAQWQSKQRSHATDDMLDPSTSFVARTMRIVPSSTPKQEKSKASTQKKSEETMTKKQRQNAAKKAKAKAEKAELEQQQAAALRAHTKNLETRRLAEITQRDKGSFKPPASSSAWNADEWKEVTKHKKVSNGQSASVDTNGKLIWE